MISMENPVTIHLRIFSKFSKFIAFTEIEISNLDFHIPFHYHHFIEYVIDTYIHIMLLFEYYVHHSNSTTLCRVLLV